ncbi:MAG: hypothetical protein DMG57_35030 [Acidobacteria bacterium]|nr:MAG: hypothetical protein DMG57_35030 [Acidobacteriota bacterium]
MRWVKRLFQPFHKASAYSAFDPENVSTGTSFFTSATGPGSQPNFICFENHSIVLPFCRLYVA